MFSKDSLKLKIQTAVTVALIASGIIPAVQAEVTDASVNNAAGTTIDEGSGTVAVDLDNGGTFTITNAGTIEASAAKDNMFGIQVENPNTTVSNLTNTGTIIGETTATNKYGGFGINVRSNGSIGTLNNSGLIKGRGRRFTGIGIYMSGGSISSLINSSRGIIEGIAGDGLGGGQSGSSAYGAIISGSGPSSSSADIDNDGIIRGLSDTSSAYGLFTYNDIGTLDNSGTILGQGDTSDAHGVRLRGYSRTSITTLNNSGTISGVAGASRAIGLQITTERVGTVNNSNTINATSATSISYGLEFFGDNRINTTIENLNNTETISAS